MIRPLRVARRSAVKARTQAANQLHALVVTAPDELRARLRAAAGVRGWSPPPPCGGRRAGATTLAATQAGAEVGRRPLPAARPPRCARSTGHLGRLVAAAAPALVALKGVGTDTAGALLVTAGDNPERLRSEAAFARLCGVAPIPASSGKTVRHRLTGAATATPTAPCTWWPSAACAGTRPPAPTSPGARPKAGPSPRSCAASSGTSPASSTPSCCRHPQPAGRTTPAG